MPSFLYQLELRLAYIWLLTIALCICTSKQDAEVMEKRRSILGRSGLGSRGGGQSATLEDCLKAFTDDEVRRDGVSVVVRIIFALCSLSC